MVGLKTYILRCYQANIKLVWGDILGAGKSSEAFAAMKHCLTTTPILYILRLVKKSVSLKLVLFSLKGIVMKKQLSSCLTTISYSIQIASLMWLRNFNTMDRAAAGISHCNFALSRKATCQCRCFVL